MKLGERAFGQVLKGEAAYGGWHDDRPGLRRLLTPQDLPLIEKPTYGLAPVVPIPTDARSQVPDGFSVERVTSALRSKSSRQLLDRQPIVLGVTHQDAPVEFDPMRVSTEIHAERCAIVP
jgi:hypothetical protein